MSDNNTLKPLDIAPLNIVLGAAFASALSIGVATAAENPFGQTEIGGQMVAENAADKAMKEGKCGEGKCGGAMNKAAKGAGTDVTDKAMKEGMCGAMGKAQKEGENAATPETPDNAVKPE